MECERFVGTGIASNAEGEKCKPEVIHARRKRKLSMTRTFSKKSSKREALLHKDEAITLLDVFRSKFDDVDKGVTNDILIDQDKSFTTTQVNEKFKNDIRQSYDWINEEINQVTA